MDLTRFSEDDVEIIDVIGEGASGTVYCAKWKSQGDRLVAVKEFKDHFSTTKPEDQRKLESLIDQLRRHHTKSKHCKHIVPMLGYYLREARKGQLVKIEVSAVMEISAVQDGKPLTLHTVLHDSPPAVPDDLLRYCEEICKALDVLHVAPLEREDCPGGGSVVHRDIKPSNILLMKRCEADEGYYASLCDFGLARDVRTTQRSMTGGVGTLDYMAPEVMAGGAHTCESDIYSFGKILEQCANMVHPRNVSESLSGVVRQCLDAIASNRPTAQEILRHIKAQRETLNAEKHFIASIVPRGCPPITGNVIQQQQTDHDDDGSQQQQPRRVEPKSWCLLSGGIAEVTESDIKDLLKHWNLYLYDVFLYENNPMKSRQEIDRIFGKYQQGKQQIDHASFLQTALRDRISIEHVFLHNMTCSDEMLRFISQFPTVKSLLVWNELRSSQMSDDGLQRFADMKSLNVLNLWGCKQITDAGVQHIAQVVNLSVLVLSDCDLITDNGVRYLSSGLKNLSLLDLWGCHLITDVGTQHISSHLGSLTFLNVSGCNKITDVAIQHLSQLRNLTALKLKGCEKITDGGVQHIIQLKKLSSLNLTDCDHITDRTIVECLSSLNTLTELNLSGNHITDIGLQHVCTLKNLSVLTLKNCTQPTDAGLQQLRTTLSVVSISGCSQITNTGFDRLTQLPNLTVLDVSGCYNLTDDGLQYVTELVNLRSINLSGCTQITDTSLHCISQLVNLSVLNLRSCYHVTDAGLQCISKKLKNLSVLVLWGCHQITDVGVQCLSQLKTLTVLNVKGCDYITSIGLQHLSGNTIVIN